MPNEEVTILCRLKDPVRVDSTTGFSWAGLLLGYPTSVTMAPTAVPYQYRWKNYAAYVQDDIRVSNRLTVNLGLRWDDPNQFHERDNRSGIFNLNTRYTCTGIWNGTPLGDRTRYDWIYFDGHAHGTITLQQALTGSCDVYFWHVGWTLNQSNPDILINYAKRMGFAAPTGIQDVAEASGNLPDPDNYESINGLKWRGSDALKEFDAGVAGIPAR